VDEGVGGSAAYCDGDRDGHAAFAGGAVGGADESVGCLVEVGVRHDDHVIFCAA